MRKALVLLCLLMVISLFAGCASDVPDLSGMICAVILDQDHVTVTDPVRWVQYGSDISFTLEADIGYDILSVDYENYELRQNNNTYVLTLHDVQTPVRVALQIQKAQAVICYHDGDTCYYENYDLTYRKRAPKI